MISRPESISVALCTRNGATYLSAQLDSIASQSRFPDEVVVCDDCSTDETVQIVDEFARRARCPVNLTVNAARLGATANFARAVEMCRGSVIVLCDQDDVWLPSKLESFERALCNKAQAAVIFSDAALVNEDLRPLGRTLWRSLHFDHAQRQLFFRGRELEALLRRAPAIGLTMAFRATYKNLVLPIPSQFAHDFWIAFVLTAAIGAALVPEQLTAYRQHAAQHVGLSGTGWRERLAFARAQGHEPHARQIEFFSAIIRRLDEAGLADSRSPQIDLLAKKVEHLRARAGLSPRRWRRLPTILRELTNLNYYRYSERLLSAARDFLL